MGTRGTIGFRLDGRDMLQYNHSDSYPSRLGMNMLNQCLMFGDPELYPGGWDEIKNRVRALKTVSNKNKPTEADLSALALAGVRADFNVGEQSPDDWYCLLQVQQGDLSKTLITGYMLAANDFIRDSLFCEWGYIVNLDEMRLEVYRGFQTKAHDRGRYARIEPSADQKHRRSPYWPCALIGTIVLPMIGTIEDAQKRMEEWETYESGGDE